MNIVHYIQGFLKRNWTNLINLSLFFLYEGVLFREQAVNIIEIHVILKVIDAYCILYIQVNVGLMRLKMQ